MATYLGLRVIASAGTEAGLELCKQNGAHHGRVGASSCCSLVVLHALLVVNHREPGYLDSVKAFAGESGVDVIMEMAAHTNLSADLDLLKKVR